uniref:Uncharacterized protein n=1 Tax=Trypanosoma vivax (strain Y486) TaxID=1055687 RepID=G0U602_TRYVY|nr:hypothetical protein, unlikely [Trypanosoma vivax Y486]
MTFHQCDYRWQILCMCPHVLPPPHKASTFSPFTKSIYLFISLLVNHSRGLWSTALHVCPTVRAAVQALSFCCSCPYECRAPSLCPSIHNPTLETRQVIKRTSKSAIKAQNRSECASNGKREILGEM